MHDRRMITLEWIASPVNDMYADAILCAILQAESMETTPSYVPAIGSKEDKMHFKECLIEMLQVILHCKTSLKVANMDRYNAEYSSASALISYNVYCRKCSETTLFREVRLPVTNLK